MDIIKIFDNINNIKNNFLLLIFEAIIENKIDIYIKITIHQGMSEPIGTLPSINNTHDISNNVASKFLILNALYDAEATKNASKSKHS